MTVAPIAYVPKAPTMASRAVAVTKSDDNYYDPPLQGIWVGGAGNLAVLPAGQDTPVTFTAVAAGTLIPIVAKKVMSTGTTATNITGFGNYAATAP